MSIDLRRVALATAGLFALDVALLWIATRLFDRETILTRCLEGEPGPERT